LTNQINNGYLETLFILIDPQAQGQAMQWPKEKGQSLIYKSLHRKLPFPQQRYIILQETKIRFLFLRCFFLEKKYITKDAKISLILPYSSQREIYNNLKGNY
jgi:hypothetical protein